MLARSILAFLAFISLAWSAPNVNIKALFAPNLSKDTEFFLPSDANYSQSVTQRWDIFTEPTYLGAIIPATEKDVQTIVC